MTSVSLYITKEEIFNNHSLLKRGAAAPRMQASLASHFATLNKLFKQIENGFEKQIATCNLPKIEKDFQLVKNNIAGILAAKKSIKEAVSFTHIATKILNQLQSDLTLNPASFCTKLAKISQSDEKTLRHFKTDEQILKSAKVYQKVLSWAQKTRFRLLEQNQSNAALLKSLDDLEGKLKRKDDKTISAFLNLIYNSNINLCEAGMTRICDGNEGMNPAYYVFVFDDPTNAAQPSDKVGIFKPANVRPLVNNPAIPAGQSASRQLASYLIDKINGGMANVPLTLKAYNQTGLGTIQAFKNNSGSLKNLMESDIDIIRPNRLHYLTIHGLRLWNIDANSANILWDLDSEGKIQLTFIDQDECLPVFAHESYLKDINNLHLSWSNFSQMDIPFDAEIKKYIRSLDPDKEALCLMELGLPIESLNLLKTVTWFIQKAAEADLLPGEIHDQLLFGELAKSNGPSLILQMIQLQNDLKLTYPDPIAKNYDQYSAAFEKKMRQLIHARVESIKADIELNGSSRRGTA